MKQIWGYLADKTPKAPNPWSASYKKRKAMEDNVPPLYLLFFLWGEGASWIKGLEFRAKGLKRDPEVLDCTHVAAELQRAFDN